MFKGRNDQQPAAASSPSARLDDRQDNYAESSSSREGIWRTVDATTQWEDDTVEHRSKDSLGDV